MATVSSMTTGMRKAAAYGPAVVASTGIVLVIGAALPGVLAGGLLVGGMSVVAVLLAGGGESIAVRLLWRARTPTAVEMATLGPSLEMLPGRGGRAGPWRLLVSAGGTPAVQGVGRGTLVVSAGLSTTCGNVDFAVRTGSPWSGGVHVSSSVELCAATRPLPSGHCRLISSRGGHRDRQSLRADAAGEDDLGWSCRRRDNRRGLALPAAGLPELATIGRGRPTVRGANFRVCAPRRRHGRPLSPRHEREYDRLLDLEARTDDLRYDIDPGDYGWALQATCWPPQPSSSPASRSRSVSTSTRPT